MGKNTVQARQWLEKCYRENSSSNTTICRWYALKMENTKKILKIILSDRKVKLQEIADILKILKGTVVKVVHENLSMKKLYSKCVPRLFTVEQKQQRIHDSRNKKDFLRRYITINETCILHFTPESKKATAEWRGEGESWPKRPKTQQSASKVMASVFWDMHGILLIDFPPKGQSINSDYYIAFWIDWKTQSRRKGLTWQRRNRCFNKIMHRSTSR